MAGRREFIRQVGVGAVGLGLAPWLAGVRRSEAAVRAGALPRSTPEAQGIRSEAVANLLAAIATSGLEFHSLMVVRHGHVVAEGWWAPFAASHRHTLYSLSKSFTSTAVGMAVADGLIDIDDPVTKFFPSDLPATIGPNLAAMKVRHLLTMNTGHAKDTMDALRASDGNWPKAFLDLGVDLEPGTHFLYNTGATYMQSAIVQKVTGRTVHALLSERLFGPLGIEGSDWEVDPTGVNVGGYGLRVTTEDIAKFGQLYLDRGRWGDRQILPAAWVDAATSRQTASQSGDNDWSQGYGYQFWRCKPAPGFYRGDGAFGQFCVVIPQMDVVVAVTSESSNMQGSMNLLWDHLLPAIRPEAALPPDAVGHRALTQVLAALAIAPAAGGTSSPRAAGVSGRTFALDDNPFGARSVRFDLSGDVATVTVEGRGGPRTVEAGIGRWVTGDNRRIGPDDLFPVARRTDVASKIAASAAWPDANTLALKWQYVENVHHDDITCTFDGDRVTIAFLNSVPAMQKQPDPRAPLTGRVL